MELTREEFTQDAKKLIAALQMIQSKRENPQIYSHTNLVDYPLADWKLIYKEDTTSSTTTTTTTNNKIDNGHSEGLKKAQCYLSHSAIVTTTAAAAAATVVTLQSDSDGVNSSGVDVNVENEVEEEFEDDTLLVDDQQYVEPDKFSSANNGYRQQSIQWNFSIVYSDTYRVPVLYFHVQDEATGQPCSRQQVLKWLHPNIPSEDEAPDAAATTMIEFDTWEFVSQEEHEFTGLPSFFLHPCQTSSRLQLLKMRPRTEGDDDIDNDDDNDESVSNSILWTWMSMILPAVNYSIPASFFLAVQTEIQSMNDER